MGSVAALTDAGWRVFRAHRDGCRDGEHGWFPAGWVATRGSQVVHDVSFGGLAVKAGVVDEAS